MKGNGASIRTDESARNLAPEEGQHSRRPSATRIADLGTGRGYGVGGGRSSRSSKRTRLQDDPKASGRPEIRQMITQPANLLSFLNDLRAAKISYRLGHCRDEAILVEVAVPGERWEIEFFEDGSVEAEIFRSDGTIHDTSALTALLNKHSG
jgi:hypothetical protein